MTSAHENVLIIGDHDRGMVDALVQARPGVQITSVATYFDGLAELVANRFTTVLAAAEPIERRPEAAVQSLRRAAGEGRIMLFGHPTLEPLSRKMLGFGADDYIVTPASAGELAQISEPPRCGLPPSHRSRRARICRFHRRRRWRCWPGCR